MILPGEINGYRWTVTFKNFLYELPKYCQAQTEDVMTYFIKNDQTYQYQIINLRPASYYVIGLSASTESGFGNATNITVHTLSSSNFYVELFFGLFFIYQLGLFIIRCNRQYIYKLL